MCIALKDHVARVETTIEQGNKSHHYHNVTLK